MPGWGPVPRRARAVLADRRGAERLRRVLGRDDRGDAAPRPRPPARLRGDDADGDRELGRHLQRLRRPSDPGLAPPSGRYDHGPSAPGRRPVSGYNGGRGLAHEHLSWALAGYAHLVTDTRGQGSRWSVGDTPDPVGSAPAQPGFTTRGIGDPRDHFYRRVFADAVRAVEAVCSHGAVDPGRVAVTGARQGGGVALAVAALAPELTALMCNVPFLCHIARGVDPRRRTRTPRSRATYAPIATPGSRRSGRCRTSTGSRSPGARRSLRCSRSA